MPNLGEVPNAAPIVGRTPGAHGCPPLSVVVPVNDVSAYLRPCLESVLAHGDHRMEVIAVDDGSGDGSGAILDAYARRDPRLRVLHLCRRSGPGPARNAGIAVARGEHVWFVDADDLLPPGAVDLVLDRLARQDPDVLLLGHALLHPNGETGRDPSGSLGMPVGECTTVWHAPETLRLRQAAWNRVVRRSLLDRAAISFPPGWYEDVPFSYLVVLAAERVAAVDTVAYLYRQRTDGAITSTPSARHFDVFDQYERLFETVDRWRAPDALRALLFARMLEHYLVVFGADGRVPPELRMEFFARMVAHYRRYLPAGGYPVPAGLNGVKHRFVQWDAYGLYSALQGVYRASRRTWRTALGPRRLTMRDGVPAGPS